MADSTATVTDPNYPYTPEQYAEVERLKLEGGYDPFNSDVSRFRPQAEGELRPYYSTLFDQLGTIEKGQLEQSNKTYGDLVKNLQESYNKRGRFFGGQAIQAEGALAGEQAQRLDEITGGFATRRASVATEMTSKAQERAALLQQQAFDDYTANKKADIERQISTKLAEYIPGYAKAIQQQLADANSPWLEIPLEEGVDYTNTPAAPAATANKGRKYWEGQGWHYIGNKADIAKLKKDKKKTVVIKDGNWMWK